MTSPRVLIVDDDESIQSLFERVFPTGGYAVRTASEGIEALRLLEEETPDLIVLDLMLPWLSDVEILVDAPGYYRLGLKR